MINVSGLGQFQNYTTGPYLAGMYNYQTYDPLMANPHLNPYLLASELSQGQFRTGDLDKSIGRDLFGINNLSNRTNRVPDTLKSADSGKSLIDQIVDNLLGRLDKGEKSNDKADKKASKKADKKAKSSSGDSNIEKLLQQLLDTKAAEDKKAKEKSPLNSLTPLQQHMMDMGSIERGGFGSGLFAFGPPAHSSAQALQMLDPTIRSLQRTDTMTPVNGLFLSMGMVPPDMSRALSLLG